MAPYRMRILKTLSQSQMHHSQYLLPRFVKLCLFAYIISIVFFCCESSNELSKGTHFTQLDPSSIGIDFVNNLEYDEDFNTYLFRSFYNGAGVGMGDFNNDGLLDLFFCGNQVDNKLYLNKAGFQFEDITDAAGIASSGAWSTGVSIVDINGDGWLDIYVCKSGLPEAENRHNELFINNGAQSPPSKGGLRGVTFTESAENYGIADLGFSVHAVFFDYDKDGDLDMYLSNNSLNPTSFVMDSSKGLRDIRDPYGGNKLYRNDTSTPFDSAQGEGSVQATSTGSLRQGSGQAVQAPQGKMTKGFTDVSEEAGIYGSAIGFGLGISVGDVNRDTWPDIFVANDFFEKDYLYINQQDGTFKESLEDAIEEISLGSMGVDIADINHDGYPEIFVTEMLPVEQSRLKTKVVFDNWDSYALKIKNGYYRQFPRNVLQLNRGPSPLEGESAFASGKKAQLRGVSFSEIGRFAGVEASDWSWGVNMADFNNDGYTDIFITNGIGKDLLDQDYTDFYFVPERMRKIYTEKGAVIKELIDNIPSVPLPNCLFIQDGDLQFQDVSIEWGLGTPGFSTGSSYGDLDNDGDLDLVVNNNNMPPFVYRNQSQNASGRFVNISLTGTKENTMAVGSQVTLYIKDQIFFQELYPMRGSMSSVDHRLHFGLGEISSIDSMEIRWPDNRITMAYDLETDQFYSYNYADNTTPDSKMSTPNIGTLLTDVSDKMSIDFVHSENEFIDFDRDKLRSQMISTEGPPLAVGDVNADGRQDFFIGNAKDASGAIFLATDNGFVQTNSEIFEKDKASEDTGSIFFDADSDGDQDLLVTSGSYEFSGSSFALVDRLYLNDGSGGFSAGEKLLPSSQLVSTSCVAVSDIDQDGDLDVFLGGRVQPFAYGVPCSSYLMENDGSGQFKNVNSLKAAALEDIGMVTDALFIDFDGDNDEDLLLTGDWMPLKLLRNDHIPPKGGTKGGFTDISDNVGFQNTNGFWKVIEKADLDGDGDEDIIAGNLGLNTSYSATLEKPITMYVNDFDQNGTIEHITTVFRGDRAYPIHMKKDITKQMPFLLKKYLKHEDYKEQTVTDIFSPDQLKDALTLEVFQNASMVFWNNDGQFEGQMLPMEAQLAPVYAILIEDIDQDGLEDIILGGNLHRVKPQSGIYGGSSGTILRNMGERSFKVHGIEESGFFVRGEIRDIKKLKIQNKKYILVARNNDSLNVYQN